MCGPTISHAQGSCSSPRKPWPFGNEYHTICCYSSGIRWGIDLVEGKDRPQQLGIQQYDNFGSTVGLLLQMLSPIYHKGFVVILDSGFCVLKGIIELRKKGVFASTLIKKRQYWPKYIKVTPSKPISRTITWVMSTPRQGHLTISPFMSMP